MSVIETRVCSKCGEETPLRTDYFQIRSGRQAGQWYTVCKLCRYKLNREYHNKNKAQIRERVACQRYGLTPEQYHALSEVCEICGTYEDLHIDHDHVTGFARGVLCGKHNRGIGMFDDDPELLERAIAYLQNVLSNQGLF